MSNFPHTTIPVYNQMVEETFAEIVRLSMVKGGEYAADNDRLDNFRRNAKSWGVTLEQCWGVYAGKHWDALQTFVRDSAQGIERERAEKLEGRVDDLLVYLLLFKLRLRELEANAAEGRIEGLNGIGVVTTEPPKRPGMGPITDRFA